MFTVGTWGCSDGSPFSLTMTQSIQLRQCCSSLGTILTALAFFSQSQDFNRLKTKRWQLTDAFHPIWKVLSERMGLTPWIQVWEASEACKYLPKKTRGFQRGFSKVLLFLFFLKDLFREFMKFYAKFYAFVGKGSHDFQKTRETLIFQSHAGIMTQTKHSALLHIYWSIDLSI